MQYFFRQSVIKNYATEKWWHVFLHWHEAQCGLHTVRITGKAVMWSSLKSFVFWAFWTMASLAGNQYPPLGPLHPRLARQYYSHVVSLISPREEKKIHKSTAVMYWWNWEEYPSGIHWDLLEEMSLLSDRCINSNLGPCVKAFRKCG